MLYEIVNKHMLKCGYTVEYNVLRVFINRL